ncbi:MAG: LEA type 2 family protein [Polyangiaceae bacterium]
MRKLLTAQAWLFVGALALSTAACVETPTVTLHHADIQGASLAGAVVDVVIAINNPNSYDIKLRDITAETTFAGKYRLPPIVMHPDLWLPSGQTTLVHVPTTLPWLMLPGLLAETVMSPAVVYNVTGSANVTATRTFGIEENNYPLQLTGTMPRTLLVNLTVGH